MNTKRASGLKLVYELAPDGTLVYAKLYKGISLVKEPILAAINVVLEGLPISVAEPPSVAVEEPPISVAEPPSTAVEEPPISVAEPPSTAVEEPPSVAVEEPPISVAEPPSVAVEEPPISVAELPSISVAEPPSTAVEEPPSVAVEEPPISVAEPPSVAVEEPPISVAELPSISVAEPPSTAVEELPIVVAEPPSTAVEELPIVVAEPPSTAVEGRRMLDPPQPVIYVPMQYMPVPQPSASIGKAAEDQILEYLFNINATNMDFQVNDTSNLKGHGDIAIKYRGKRICVEIKHYQTKLPLKEITKYRKSLALPEYDAGILIQVGKHGFAVSEDIKTPIDLKFDDRKPSAYLTRCQPELIYPIINVLIANLSIAIDESNMQRKHRALLTINEKVSKLRKTIDTQKKSIATIESAIEAIIKLSLV
jgi:hypothetical protein